MVLCSAVSSFCCCCFPLAVALSKRVLLCTNGLAIIIIRKKITKQNRKKERSLHLWFSVRTSSFILPSNTVTVQVTRVVDLEDRPLDSRTVPPARRQLPGHDGVFGVKGKDQTVSRVTVIQPRPSYHAYGQHGHIAEHVTIRVVTPPLEQVRVGAFSVVVEEDLRQLQWVNGREPWPVAPHSWSGLSKLFLLNLNHIPLFQSGESNFVSRGHFNIDAIIDLVDDVYIPQ